MGGYEVSFCFCVSFWGRVWEGVLSHSLEGGGGACGCQSVSTQLAVDFQVLYFVGIVLSLGCLHGRCVVMLMLITDGLIALVFVVWALSFLLITSRSVGWLGVFCMVV